MSKDDSDGVRSDETDPATTAWSAPSISLSVETPLLAVDAPVPTVSAPTVTMHASVPVVRDDGGTTGSFINGTVVFGAAGTSTPSGAVCLEFTSEGPFETEYDEDEFGAAGWTRVSDQGPAVCFRSAALGDGESREVPRFRWRGPIAATGRLMADVHAENPDVAGTGVTVRLR